MSERSQKTAGQTPPDSGKAQTPPPFESEDLPRNTRAAIARLLRLLARQKWMLAAVAFSSLIGIGLFAVTPLILGQAIDALIGIVKTYGFSGAAAAALPGVLLPPLALCLGMYALSSAFAFVQEYMMAGIGERLTLSLRRRMSEKITRLPLSFYDAHRTGDILSRVTNDLDKVAEVLKTGLLQFISAVFNIAISVVIMLIKNPLLTALILAALSVSMFATKWISRKNFEAAAENQAVLGELNGRIEEYFTGNLVIKSFGRQQTVTDAVREVSARQYAANRRAQFVEYAIYPAIRFLTQLGFVVTAIAGGAFAAMGSMSIGMVQAFLQYVNQISEPITQASYFVSSFQSAMAASERVFDFLDGEEEAADTPAPQRLCAPRGAVRFEHVRFGYSPDAVLMRDVTLSVRPNETVAVVGPTGAGKTTLVNLLMRFYELDGGRILIDDVDIKELSRSSLRRMVGMVLQDAWLFQGTIAENIAYGRMDATREEIVRAARAARCDHFIRTLEKGYDTLLSGEGSELSQGQMQLLTIARAMLANPALMILDEATSSVDTRTEAEVQKAMAEIMQGKTSFVIAHRLSTIQSADMILVMKNGTIIEQGTHEELLAGNTFYAELYNSQFSGGTEG